MFSSFFPRPRIYFSSLALWGLGCIVLWYSFAGDAGRLLSLGDLFGIRYPEALLENADQVSQAAFATAEEEARRFWRYQYVFSCFIAFVVIWYWLVPHPWTRWSVVGTGVIVFSSWFQVQLDVAINEWFGTFYDMIQVALTEADTVAVSDYYRALFTFAQIALVMITVRVLTNFLASHYVFRWRTAMNNRYMAMWERVRHIEGASQRVQEDTMRFAAITENLGLNLIQSVMLLVAFLPILWGLSEHVGALPIVGEIPQALVFLAILWSIFGTGLVALAGIRLPGLEFRNQRVEAAFRKELVLGEDSADRARPPTVGELFGNVRKNYFRLYFNYLYFNVFRFGYLQAGVLVPYVALGPTIVAAGFTLGVMQQIIRAFDRVENSFQYLVNSWTTIVELISIYKRLQAFEAQIAGQPLPKIDRDFESGATTPY